MKIIEKAIVGKKSQEACEDGLAINDSFVAVIDGSTSKTAVEISPGMSNGRYCMELIRWYIGIMPADISVDDFCANVTAVVRNEYMAHALSLDYLERHPVERLTASAVVYSCCHKQVWMVGDCQCIVGGTYYDNPKPQEAVLADKRAGYLKAAMKGGLKVGDVCTYDPGRRFIMHDLKECCMHQNIDYPVIDGFEIPTSKVKVINVNDDCGEIILASDGYPFLKPTLEDSEMALSRQLADDPLCIGTFKATKGLMDGNASFDDRCYVRFTV